jgi:hypothetical protein
VNGELSQQAGRELMASLAPENYGLPAHVVADGQAWFADMTAQLGGDQAEPEPRGR